MRTGRFLKKAGPTLAIGAAIMYFFDPENGRRRRAVFRDRSAALVRDKEREIGRRTRYVAGKAQGVKHAIGRSDGQSEPANDPTIQHKIESEVLRYYPKGAINVNVEEGVAVLRGQLRRPEQINALIDDVARVDGVTQVRSLLHLEGTAAPSTG